MISGNNQHTIYSQNISTSARTNILSGKIDSTPKKVDSSISRRTSTCINGCDINTQNRYNILNSCPTTYSYNIGFYDDTKIKQRLSILETDVTNLQHTDWNFEHRLSLLENHEQEWATKQSVYNLDVRVTRLENIPIGLTRTEMNEILYEN